MKIKKFVASTLKEAIELMKDEFGGEAVILSQRLVEKETPKGKVRMFEVTSGIEKEDEKFVPPAAPQKEKGNLNDELLALAEKIKDQRNNYRRENETPAKKITVAPKKRPVKAEPHNKQVSETALKEVVDTLIHREVSKPIIRNMVNQLKKSREFITEENLDDYVVSNISSMLPTTSFEVSKNRSPKIVALIGPTGVGKTTCIAKLAAISKILHNLDIGIISIDTYRLGAIDQLRIFSEISNIDMLVAYEAEEMPGLINQLRKKDVIFIDTAGRSQKNKKDLLATRKFLDSIKVNETYLTLSATASTKNLLDVSERFNVFDYDSLIFTKVDEGVAYGNILNAIVSTQKPVIYLTNGQVIPDDIIAADSDFIASMIYKGKITE